MDLWFFFVARVVLAAVFVTAGVAKLRDISGTRRAAEDLGVPSRFAHSVARCLPILEVAAAFLLIPGSTARWGAALTALLLIAFTGLIAVTLASGARPACACFGAASAAPIGWGTIVRNVGLMVLASSVVASGGMQASPTQAFEALQAQPWVAVTLLLAALLAVQSWRLHRARHDEPDPLASTDRVLAPGTRAPDFSLRSLKDAQVTLGTLLGEGRPTLLVFADPDCAPCRGLGPDLARWDSELRDHLTLAVISKAGAGAAGGEGSGVRPERVLVDGQEVASTYRSPGTPSAVLIDPRGMVASEMVAGPTRIRELVGRITDPGRTVDAEDPVMSRRRALRGAVAMAGAAAVGVVAGAKPAAAQSLPQLDVLPCPSGFEKCDGVCRDTDINPDHCGACGRTCAEGEMCRGGECVPCTCSEPCPSGTADCNGACADLSSDPSNCGTCGAVCGSGQICQNGACVAEETCSDGMLNGDETDIDCGGSCQPCADGLACVQGSDCMSGDCVNGFCASPCPPGTASCDGRCVDLSTDVTNCGACGSACAPGEVCSSGTCVPQ